MKSRLVGFLKQAIDLFNATPSRANFLTAVAFSKSVRLIATENERSYVCKQT